MVSFLTVKRLFDKFNVVTLSKKEVILLHKKKVEISVILGVFV